MYEKNYNALCGVFRPHKFVLMMKLSEVSKTGKFNYKKRETVKVEGFEYV